MLTTFNFQTVIALKAHVYRPQPSYFQSKLNTMMCFLRFNHAIFVR